MAVRTMNNWQWDHVAQQNPATIYPVGWLEAYKHKRLRSEWRYFVGRVKARQWRSVRNTFNGYLAEHDGHPHNAGRGWTKRASERRVNRLCDEAMLTTLAEWWPEGGDPPLPPEPAVGSVVRAHGRLWHSKADFWHTSLGDVPKKWANLAAAPDLSPVVAVDDVADWLRRGALADGLRAEFGGWDK